MLSTRPSAPDATVCACGRANDHHGPTSRERNAHVHALRVIFSSVDVNLVFYIVLALIPNLFLILWAMARLSRDVRVLKAKLDMTENDINLLDQSISSLTAEFQAIRKIETAFPGMRCYRLSIPAC